MSALDKLLNDDDSDVRLAAAVALGEIGPKAKSEVPSLTALLRNGNEDGWMRENVADALGKIGPDAEAVSALTELLRNEDVELRWSAIVALDTAGSNSRTAVPILVDFFREDYRGELAAMEVVKIGPAAVPLITKKLADANVTVRRMPFWHWAGSVPKRRWPFRGLPGCSRTKTPTFAIMP